MPRRVPGAACTGREADADRRAYLGRMLACGDLSVGCTVRVRAATCGLARESLRLSLPGSWGRAFLAAIRSVPDYMVSTLDGERPLFAGGAIAIDRKRRL
jgi:hypothetical protein